MKSLKRIDIKEKVLKFREEFNSLHRYASYDYCYNYFHLSDCKTLEKDIEKTCLHLAFYLASWGMLRGSSFLLQKSIKFYEPLIEYIIELKKSNPLIWELDVDKYNKEGIEIIINIYDKIKELLIKNNERHIVLITKIMLGVFGCIPAFDNYFSNTFKEISNISFNKVNKKTLLILGNFYLENKNDIDMLSDMIYTIDFNTGKNTHLHYKKAKIIDMYGFSKGFYKNKENRINYDNKKTF